VRMREAQATGALETYLAQLEAALTKVPTHERQDILLETRSHVVERTHRSPFRSVTDILAELGPPGTYAQQFLTEQTSPVRLSDTLRASDPLHGVARLATGSWRVLPLLLFVVSAYAVAVFALFVAVSKLIEPDATGLWIHYVNGERRSISFVLSDPRQPGREVLGYALVPLALLVALTIHVAMAALLRQVLRRDTRAS
jgi:hypothetical protein